MNGLVLDEIPVGVDIWTPQCIRNARIFFLSHVHCDHLYGLTKSWHHKIYTSKINAEFLKGKFGFDDSILVQLELDHSYIIPLDSNVKINVTLIDANHIPGSVMFLFQGHFGTVLYTGDTRYNAAMLSQPILSEAIQSGIDTLYLDNTFCHPSFNFPSREIAKQMIISFIESRSDCVIKIGLHSIGKEDLLEAIATYFQIPICVQKKRYNFLKLIRRDMDKFTLNHESTRIHAVDRHEMTLKNMKQWKSYQPTAALLASAFSPNSSLKEVATVIPYSDHSSFHELIEMVKALKPHRIVPIIKNSERLQGRINVADMSIFDKFVTDVHCYTHSLSSFSKQNIGKHGSPSKQKRNFMIPKRRRLNRKCPFSKGVSDDFSSEYEDEPSTPQLPQSVQAQRKAQPQICITAETDESSNIIYTKNFTSSALKAIEKSHLVKETNILTRDSSDLLKLNFSQSDLKSFYAYSVFDVAISKISDICNHECGYLTLDHARTFVDILEDLIHLVN